MFLHFMMLLWWDDSCCFNDVTFAKHHLGGNVYNDINTLIDVLFPKFESERGAGGLLHFI
jgi:hypothetical protein